VVLAVVLGGFPQTATAPPGGQAGGGPASSSSAPSSAASSAPAGSAAAGVANPSQLPGTRASELPAEARQTLALIAKGGPYPYARDDVNFGNFEGMLPRKPSGYYREYTVRTPGEADRGARRIIAGRTGEKYYTPDHYNSFTFIIEGK
jgi:ribonuclease T1